MTNAVLLSIFAADFHKCFADCLKLMAKFIVQMKGHNLDLQLALNHGETLGLFTPFFMEHCGIENLKFYYEIETFCAN